MNGEFCGSCVYRLSRCPSLDDCKITTLDESQGWIQWHGGRMPVDGETYVQCKLRYPPAMAASFHMRLLKAHSWDWDWLRTGEQEPWEIIAYRIFVPGPWIDWCGSEEEPVIAHDAFVVCKLRDGAITDPEPPSSFYWHHDGGAGDIFQYQVFEVPIV